MTTATFSDTVSDRKSTQRKFPVNWMTITGYVLLSMAQYLVFAPFYWFFLLRNVRRIRAEAKRPDDQAAPELKGE